MKNAKLQIGQIVYFEKDLHYHPLIDSHRERPLLVVIQEDNLVRIADLSGNILATVGRQMLSETQIS